MDDNDPVTIPKIGKEIHLWIGILGFIGAFISICIGLGITFGPLKDLPPKVAVLETQYNDINGRLNILQVKHDTMNGQLTSIVAEQRAINDGTKKLEILLGQLSITAISKNEFYEWKSTIERSQPENSILKRH